MYNMFLSNKHGVNSLSLVHVKQYFMHVFTYITAGVFHLMFLLKMIKRTTVW